jgi:hypothetical protein
MKKKKKHTYGPNDVSVLLVAAFPASAASAAGPAAAPAVVVET